MLEEANELRSAVFDALVEHGYDIDYNSVAIMPQSDMSIHIVAISNNPTQKWVYELGDINKDDLIVGEFESISAKEGMNKLQDKTRIRREEAFARIKATS